MKRKYCIAMGPNGSKVEVFTSENELRKRYNGIWGFFPSRKCAEWILDRSDGNPHFYTASIATKIYSQERSKKL